MTCSVCNGPLPVEPKRARRYCSLRCARRVYRERRFPPLPLVGIDSETVNGEDGKARLVLVVRSDGKLLADVERIPTERVLPFLLEPRAELWTYFGDYDINFWLADFPARSLDRLRRTNWASWRQYRVHHIPRRIFEVWDRRAGLYTCIYDAFPFAQTSFVRWLEDWKLATHTQTELIRAMKEQRARFSQTNRKRIETYTRREVECIARGVEQLKERITAAGFSSKRLLGPGAVAAQALRAHNVKAHMPAREHPKAEQAYYGGRIETAAVGIVKRPLWYYDINSAYPAATATLPCFRHGRWMKAGELRPGDVALVQVSWKPRGEVPRWGPFPVRAHEHLPLRYRAAGSGWYWWDELAPWIGWWEGERTLSGSFCFRVLNAHVWVQSCKHEPFAWVRELYAKRQALKAAGDPAEYALKLVLNSCYGKLAQRTGQHPYRCVEWAGLITARTRSRLGAVLRDLGEHVLIAATDGIITTTPFAEVGHATGLGAWSLAGRYDWANIWQPGFYVLSDGKARTRGFTRNEVDVQALRREWREHGMLGKASVARRRVIGYRLATAQRKPETLGRWIEETSELHYWPLPRRHPTQETIEAGGDYAVRTVAPWRKEISTKLEAEAEQWRLEREKADLLEDGDALGYERD